MNCVPNAAASYPSPTPTRLIEEEAKKYHDNSTAFARSSASAAAQINHTATLVMSALNVPSMEIFPELPPELHVIIADYENQILEADLRIAPYLLERLGKALTGKLKFATEVSRINKVMQLHQQLSTRDAQLAMQNTMLEIFDEVRTNLSQIAPQELRGALLRLKSNGVHGCC